MSAVTAAFVLAVPAYTASNHQVQGRGVTNQFLCESGFLASATIDISAGKNRGTIGGFFQIFGLGVTKFGSVTSGSINPNSYTLSGPVNAFACAGPTSTLPAQATITGECGEGVTIFYSDTHGEVGEFRGNVICS